MPHFSLPVLADGPLIQALVAVSEARADALKTAGVAIPAPIPIVALVDTGASHTCVDRGVLSKLGLTPTGSVPVHTPSTGQTPLQIDQFDVGILIPGSVQNPTAHIIPTLPVTGNDFSAQRIDALIGRDILQSCVLVYNGGTAQFTLAF